MIIAAGLDLGTAGKTSIFLVKGEGYKIETFYSKALSSISSPDVEVWVERVNKRYSPSLWLMELNGPGAVFIDYIQRFKPEIPIATIDTSVPLPDGYAVKLWDDIEINNKVVLNIRAAMYWSLRLFFRDQRILLHQSDDELSSQLSSLQWDHDMQRGDKIFMVSKRKLKLKSSELDDEPFSKSPDKADSLALATFAYVIAEQQGLESADTSVGDDLDDSIVEPVQDGFFPLVGFEEAA